MSGFKLKLSRNRLFLIIEFTFFLLLTFITKSMVCFCTVIGLFCIMIYSRYNSKGTVTFHLFFFLLLFLVTENVLSYEFLAQARVLLQTNTDVYYWLVNGHVHAIRLLISYPAYLLAEFYDVNIDIAFSYYCCIIFLLILLLMVSIQRKRIKIGGGIILLSAMFTLVLALVMNGRVNFAFLGLEILIIQMEKLNEVNSYSKLKIILMAIIGLFLTFVSSGTMIVAIGYLVIYLIIWCIKKDKITKKMLHVFSISLLLILLFMTIGQYVLKMINKNILFFGGGVTGILNMLNHGITKNLIGSFGISRFFIIMLLGLILIFNLILILHVYKKHFNYMSIILAINVGIYGSLFGLSAGTMSFIPLYIISVEVVINRIRITQRSVVTSWK